MGSSVCTDFYWHWIVYALSKLAIITPRMRAAGADHISLDFMCLSELSIFLGVRRVCLSYVNVHVYIIFACFVVR